MFYTIEAPTYGLILLTATATVTIHGDATACTFGWGTSAGAYNSHSTFVGVLDGSGTQRRQFSATTLLHVRVQPGNYTYYLTVEKSSAWGMYQIDAIDVIYSIIFLEDSPITS